MLFLFKHSIKNNSYVYHLYIIRIGLQYNLRPLLPLPIKYYQLSFVLVFNIRIIFIHNNEIWYLICIIVWGPFCWKESKINRIHIHAQCINWSAGISYPHSRERDHWLTHFFWGLLSVTAEKGTAIEISDARSLVFFSWNYILWPQGTCFYVWLWYKRERTSKHSAIWSIHGGYARSYRSDSLVFWGPFFYILIF
jgi:hypothetical protein